MKRNDLSNKKFGRLKVIGLKGSVLSGGRKRVFWNCRCDCGSISDIESSRLVSGMTRSCGCIRNERIGSLNRTHGESKKHKEHRTWSNMKSRCYCITDAKYKNYGARGIKVCSRWIDSYENFLKDMGRAPSPEHSIDRIDVNGNYEPSNCRWATDLEQANNKQDTIVMLYKGEKCSLRQWCNKNEAPYKKIHSLYRYSGYSLEDIIIQYGKL